MTETNQLVFAQYNVAELTTEKVQHCDTTQIAAAAEVIQSAPEPDVLLLNELSNNFQQGWERRHNAEAFLDHYLCNPQRPDLDGVDFEYFYAPPSNTGIPSGMDFHKDGLDLEPGTRAYGNDCYGYGEYPGRYAMTLFSKYPIDRAGIRTFRRFRWKDMPDDKIPTNDNFDVYLTEDEQEQFRLPSKTHADIPIETSDETVHVIIAHPTPPVHDGPENLNGRRCHDEIRLVGDYIRGAEYVYDDDGVTGGFSTDDPFIVMGDMNAAPGEVYRGDAGGRKPGEFHFDAAQRHLLENPSTNAEVLPMSPGGRARGNEHATQFGDDWARQADYVLPSVDIEIAETGAVWPGPDTDLQALRKAVQMASNHVMIWAAVEHA